MANQTHSTRPKDDARTGIVAIIAIICAIGSYLATFTGSPILGLIAALAAAGLGIVGLAISVSPKVGGGIMSIIAIVLGVFGIGVAILGLIGVIIF
ncbi:MAG: hypothetical protein WD294_03800 [Phycisphaeraceae bacterium]